MQPADYQSSHFGAQKRMQVFKSSARYCLTSMETGMYWQILVTLTSIKFH
jgi:hypothetical protein